MKTPPAGGRRPLAWTCELCFLAERELPVQSVWGHAARFSPNRKKCRAGPQLSCGDNLHGRAAQAPGSQRPRCRFPPPHCWDVWARRGRAPCGDRHGTWQAAQRAHSRDLGWRERDSKPVPCAPFLVNTVTSERALTLQGLPGCVRLSFPCSCPAVLSVGSWPVAACCSCGRGGSHCSSPEAGLGRADDMATAWPPWTPASQGGCWCLGPRPSWPRARPCGRPRGPP